ncbi:MAG: hypothetical protein SFV18_19755 [Bryobacteraceae bacterium]|nr:hypothetical protein [Bryobacteraceae bacterium]
MFAALSLLGSVLAQTPPQAGPVTILKSSEIKPGMKATAWTVFEGSEPEAVPIEIIGLWKNAWGPKQDIILGKMGGRAARTNVAGGMSGSPVYIDGKLIGAVALRLSVFSPDAICGITPIELMLEINEFDQSKPSAPVRASTSVAVPGELVASQPLMVPIEAPLTLSGFHEETMRQFAPLFAQFGVKAVLGGGGGTSYEVKPAPDWKNALRPGQTMTGVLVSGDMSVTGLGTVSYNDGRRVLGFGHPFFNLGPVNMPMSKGEILMVLSSAFAPNKFGNATEIVGALKQDRHSGIMGVLGEQAPMIPVTMKVRSFGATKDPVSQKDFRFNIFVQQKWTPFLMMLTLFNSIQQLNDFADEATYKFSGSIRLEGGQRLDLSTMAAPADMPMPTPMLLAGWWADKFNKLFGNPVAMPKLDGVDVTVDLLPQRRIAAVESVWSSAIDVEPGDKVRVKAFLRPYRGERIEREFTWTVPPGLSKGEHRLLLSDADTLNRLQSAAGSLNRFLDVSQTVSLLKQERTNTKIYVSLLQPRPTVYYEDKAMPNLPASVLNVLGASRNAGRPVITSGETATEQLTLDFDQLVTGSATVRLNVK